MNQIKDEDIKAVSIIVPVYNEQDSIYATITNIVQTMEKSSIICEVIVVDDGSTDNTSREIQNYFQAMAKGEKSNGLFKVKYLYHPFNRGYGAALKTGINKALYDYVVITDGDSTYPNEMIPELVGEIPEADMVVGARIENNAKIPLIRQPAKWALGKLANYLADFKIPDFNSGLRVMKKDIVLKYENILPDGFSFTTTITLAMLTNGNCVKYIPINYHKRSGKSKIRPVKDTLNFIQLIIRTVLYFNPLKIFIPMSVLLVISAFVLTFASWMITGRIMDVGTGILLMTAVIVMAIGMLADLIDKRMR